MAGVAPALAAVEGAVHADPEQVVLVVDVLLGSGHEVGVVTRVHRQVRLGVRGEDVVARPEHAEARRVGDDGRRVGDGGAEEEVEGAGGEGHGREGNSRDVVVTLRLVDAEVLDAAGAAHRSLRRDQVALGAVGILSIDVEVEVEIE